MAEQTRGEILAFLEGIQQSLQVMSDSLQPYRDRRRSVALAMTKLDEARLWLGEAIVLEQ